jgi:hypothetical protein
MFLYVRNHGFCYDVVIFCLWDRVGLLAFHLALVNNPREALVIRTFASVLYHGNWEEGVKFAKEQAEMHVDFVPEISGSSNFKSDEELAKGVTLLASLVQDSISTLTETENLFKSMSRYPFSPCSGFVSTSLFIIYIANNLKQHN